METVYRNWERRSTRPHSTHGSSRAKVSLGVRERRRLTQLGICVVLFFAVFIGKGVLPDKMVSVRDGLTGLIGSNTDFRAAFADLGRAISNGEPVLNTLGDLCVEVFGGTRVTIEPPIEKLLPSYESECTFLNSSVTAVALLERRLGIKETPRAEPEPAAQPVETAPPAAETPAPVETAPPAEPAVVHMDYSGPALPANATMDKYALGLEKTVTPVANWWLSSGFGWREHPVDGEEKFHNGIDMAANDGSSVMAFADGKVDFIGDSPGEFGLYAQITHANGVVTFYCHCSELLVRQGQTVKAGDAIAKSGESGNATGPHLHFEIKKDGVRLNPLYYVEGA